MKKRSSRMPDMWDESGAAYFPARDGEIEEYVERQENGNAVPLFRGMEHFDLLKDKGLLLPRYSIIRLMWNIGRGDEHFEVTKNFQLEGMEASMHSGREGVFKPEDIIGAKNAPCFEAQRLRNRAVEKWMKENGITELA